MTLSQNSTKFSCYLKFMLSVFFVSQCSNYTFVQGNVTVAMDNRIGGGPGSKIITAYFGWIYKTVAGRSRLAI